jgi:hypothetical protein
VTTLISTPQRSTFLWALLQNHLGLMVATWPPIKQRSKHFEPQILLCTLGNPDPPVLMQILSSLRQITSMGVGLECLQRITFNSRYLRLGLKRLGFIVYGHDDSPVVPMILYHPGKLPAFSREMLKRGIVLSLPAIRQRLY